MGTEAERLRYRGAEKTRVSHMQAEVLSKQIYSLWGTFAESVALGRNAERSRVQGNESPGLLLLLKAFQF